MILEREHKTKLKQKMSIEEAGKSEDREGDKKLLPVVNFIVAEIFEKSI